MVETREKQLHLKYSDLHYSLLLIQVYIQILYNKLVLSEKIGIGLEGKWKWRGTEIY